MNSTVTAAVFWVYAGAASLAADLAARHYGNIGALEVVLGLGGAGLGALWYERNAREHGVYRSGYAVSVLLLAVVAIPVYLVQSRGWKAGGLAMLKIAGLAVLTSVLLAAVEAVLFGAIAM